MAHQVSQLFVWFTEKFVEEARTPHAEGEYADQKTGAKTCTCLPEQQQQNNEQEQPFKPCLIQLAWVASDFSCTRIRENHRPRDIACAAPKLAIVEIGKTAKQHAHRDAHHNIVKDAQEIQLVSERYPSNRGQDTQDTAVKAHAAIPHAQKLPADKAIAGKISERARDACIAACIERGIAQSPAKDHAECAIEE